MKIDRNSKQVAFLYGTIWFLFMTSCILLAPRRSEANDLEGTISAQSTWIAHLSTRVADQIQVNESQWQAISYLSTQMPFALNLITTVPPGETITSTAVPPQNPTPYPVPVCTPPACTPDEVYYCPDKCPGGCGTTCATVTPGVASGPGRVAGKICFPSEYIPSMTLYFQEVSTGMILNTPIVENQLSYDVDLPAGVYVAFAWLPDKTFGGSYSQFVLCGLDVACTDHTLVPFVVQEGRVTTGVDICDWYGDVGDIPSVPE